MSVYIQFSSFKSASIRPWKLPLVVRVFLFLTTEQPQNVPKPQELLMPWVGEWLPRMEPNRMDYYCPCNIWKETKMPSSRLIPRVHVKSMSINARNQVTCTQMLLHKLFFACTDFNIQYYERPVALLCPHYPICPNNARSLLLCTSTWWIIMFCMLMYTLLYW